ncbi:MAG: TMEM165/GDT1 family protein [Myxococcaceae bacterium]
MDYKVMLTTFGAVFLAELGDKTQLATLTFATTGSSKWAVFSGSALALVATSAIAVLAGEAISRVIPSIWLKRVAGIGFLVIGAWVLIGAVRAES